MVNKKYKMSFTTGSIFYQESLIFAELYLNGLAWKDVRAKALEANLLQARTESTAIRITREIVTRLICLTDDELKLLIKGDRSEQNSILWISVCRKYLFIREFSTEVIRENYLNYQYELSYSHFDSFFYKKMDWNEDLESISEMTRKKLRQVLFRMLREVEIISDDKNIIPAVLPLRVIDIMKNNSSEDFYIFPTLEAA